WSLTALLCLPERDEADQNVAVAALKRWLGRNSGWLLVADNADDPKAVYDLLPVGGPGHLLVTTRDPAIVGVAEVVPVEKMVEGEGAALILRRAGLLKGNSTLRRAK